MPMKLNSRNLSIKHAKIYSLKRKISMRCKFKIATKKARKALIVLKLITFLIRREKSK